MTLAELRALLRVTLADATAWPDATLDRWIAGAVRLYSAHFPRRLRAVLALSAGTQAYAVPGGLGAAGRDLGRVPGGPGAAAVPPVCAGVVGAFAAGGRGATPSAGWRTTTTSAAAVGYIVFAETVADGESAVVEYWGPHPEPAVGADTAVHHGAGAAPRGDLGLRRVRGALRAGDGRGAGGGRQHDRARAAGRGEPAGVEPVQGGHGPAGLAGRVAELGAVQPCWGRYGL